MSCHCCPAWLHSCLPHACVITPPSGHFGGVWHVCTLRPAMTHSASRSTAWLSRSARSTSRATSCDASPVKHK